jgi:hypothetical protein
MEIFLIVNGLADPTDRTFDPFSSPGYSGSIENAHAAAALSDQANIKIGYLQYIDLMHFDCYPVVGC